MNRTRLKNGWYKKPDEITTQKTSAGAVLYHCTVCYVGVPGRVRAMAEAQIKIRYTVKSNHGATVEFANTIIRCGRCNRRMQKV